MRSDVTHFVRPDGTALCDGWASDMGALPMNTLYCCGVCLQRLYALILTSEEAGELGHLTMLREHELRRLRIVVAHPRGVERRGRGEKPN